LGLAPELNVGMSANASIPILILGRLFVLIC